MERYQFIKFDYTLKIGKLNVKKCSLNITLLVTVRIMVELRFFIFFSCIKYVLFVNKTIQK